MGDAPRRQCDKDEPYPEMRWIHGSTDRLPQTQQSHNIILYNQLRDRSVIYLTSTNNS
jgi:hypothetical protein